VSELVSEVRKAKAFILEMPEDRLKLPRRVVSQSGYKIGVTFDEEATAALVRRHRMRSIVVFVVHMFLAGCHDEQESNDIGVNGWRGPFISYNQKNLNQCVAVSINCEQLNAHGER